MQTKFDRTVQVLGAQVLGKQRSLPQRTALVRGIYSVAQMFVALDGRILPYESSAILSLFGACGQALNSGGLPNSVHADLLAQARKGGADDEQMAEKFAEFALAVLPPGFLDATPFDARFAFVTWLAMCLADGTFDPVERLAYMRLLDTLIPRPEWIRPGEKRPSADLLAFRRDLEEYLSYIDKGDAAAAEAAFDALLAKCCEIPVSTDGPAVTAGFVTDWATACGEGSDSSDVRRRQLLDAEHPSLAKVVFRITVAGGEEMTLSAQELVTDSHRHLCMQDEPATRTLWLNIREAVRKVDAATADFMVPRCDYRDGTCHELRVRPCNRCHGGYSA